VVIGKKGNDYVIEGEVVTQNQINRVDVSLGRLDDPKKTVVTVTGLALAATMHSHPGTGTIIKDGKKVQIIGGLASRADKAQVELTGKPLFILNSTVALLRLNPGDKRATPVLTGKDYQSYLKRAEAAQDSRAGGN
jgi:hypothetical protein